MSGNLVEALQAIAVTDDNALAGKDLVDACLEAVALGATMVQLRFKTVGADTLAQMARALLASLSVPLIINDRVDVAIAVGAAGVHLGPDDMPATLVRRIAPPGFIIGVSVGLEREIANGRAGDYWGIGPVNQTVTKAAAGEPLGFLGFAKLAARSNGVPCVAIGGVGLADLPMVRQYGGVGIAGVREFFAGR